MKEQVPTETYHVARPLAEGVQISDTGCARVDVRDGAPHFFDLTPGTKPKLILPPGTWLAIHRGPFPALPTVQVPAEPPPPTPKGLKPAKVKVEPPPPTPAKVKVEPPPPTPAAEPDADLPLPGAPAE